MRDVEAAVRATLVPDAAIESVELVGSRARGDAMPFSDWDFAIKTHDFAGAAERVAELVAPLMPLGQFWDPLAAEWCYILMMRGPFGVDLIFDEGHELEPPWVVTDETLPTIDTHFWNWIWWLSTKDRRGKTERVAEELGRVQWFLLGPLGNTRVPSGVADAVACYIAERGVPEGALALDVLSGLRRVGYEV
jgi:hypothetical protein